MAIRQSATNIDSASCSPPFLFTVRLEDKARLLRSRVIVIEMHKLLATAVSEFACQCEAYAFLTHELRLVIKPSSSVGQPRSAFLKFLSLSSTWFRDSGYPGWESNFFTRRLTCANALEAAIDEVLSAPIVLGRGETLRHHPYVGPTPEVQTG